MSTHLKQYENKLIFVLSCKNSLLKDRLWRKTRSITPNSTCIGADPNRNWDSHWCGEYLKKSC